MPYTSIEFSAIADPQISELFDRANAFLADVYTMLSNRPLKRTRGGGCNLTATLALLCVVDAMATYVWPIHPMGDRKQRARFTKLITSKLPWGRRSSGWVPINVAAELFWREFRNPLAHGLGRDRPSTFRKAGHVEPTVGVWGNIKPQRIGAVDARKNWPRHWPVLSVLTDAKGSRDKLTVAALYWAVKAMVRDLAASQPERTP